MRLTDIDCARTASLKASFPARYSWVLGDASTVKCSARCIERLLLGRSICVSLCAALQKPATPAVAIQLLELSCVAAPLSLPVWQQLFDWGHLNMHGTRIWASVWETIPSVTKPYNLETAPPSLWLLCVLALPPLPSVSHESNHHSPGTLRSSLAPTSDAASQCWNARCSSAA